MNKINIIILLLIAMIIFGMCLFYYSLSNKIDKLIIKKPDYIEEPLEFPIVGHNSNQYVVRLNYSFVTLRQANNFKRSIDK